MSFIDKYGQIHRDKSSKPITTTRPVPDSISYQQFIQLAKSTNNLHLIIDTFCPREEIDYSDIAEMEELADWILEDMFFDDEIEEIFYINNNLILAELHWTTLNSPERCGILVLPKPQ